MMAEPISKWTVTFANETDIHQSKRPANCFSRTSQQYHPGKYSCYDGDEWENTNFMDDLGYSLQHLRVRSVISVKDNVQFQNEVLSALQMMINRLRLPPVKSV